MSRATVRRKRDGATPPATHSDFMRPVEGTTYVRVQTFIPGNHGMKDRPVADIMREAERFGIRLGSPFMCVFDMTLGYAEFWQDPAA